jgi:hypothetical protein
MKNKILRLSFIFFIVTSAFTCNFAYARTDNLTIWKSINASLSDLLNDGWKLVNVSATDVATSSVPGQPGFRSAGLVYVLFKNNKYITCILYNPDATKDNYSVCRLIN